MKAANDSDLLCNEIRYFMAFSLLKQLLAQGLLTKDSCRKLNVALAREYRVFRYQI